MVSAGILAGVTIVFVAGLVDDLRQLSPIAKLAAQILAAVVVLASGLDVEIVGNDVLAWAIGLLWLVGITNAFNLLDNMDGLAATRDRLVRLLRDRRGDGARERHGARARARARPRVRRLPAVQPPAAASAAVFMGDSGAW